MECRGQSPLAQEAIIKPAHSHAGRAAGCNVLYCRRARGERRRERAKDA